MTAFAATPTRTVSLLGTGALATVAASVATPIVAAAATVVGAVAVTGGYHSTRLSRVADLVESTAVVLVLPLGMVAAGGIEALRRLTSG